MALDLMMEEKSYNYLVYFGIQGKNYIIKNNKIDLPKGVTADNNTYPPDAAGFWFTNKDQFLPLASWDDNYIALRNTIKKALVSSPLSSFSLDQTKVKTEIANLNSVMTQYYNPICLGMVKNVDEAFATLDKKLKAAGVEKVKAEALRQLEQYFRERNQ
jgi:putative aldouronate transport system substrate-binding protein